MYISFLMSCLILMLGNILHCGVILSHVNTDIKYLSTGAGILLHNIFLIIV